MWFTVVDTGCRRLQRHWPPQHPPFLGHLHERKQQWLLSRLCHGDRSRTRSSSCTRTTWRICFEPARNLACSTRMSSGVSAAANRSGIILAASRCGFLPIILLFRNLGPSSYVLFLWPWVWEMRFLMWWNNNDNDSVDDAAVGQPRQISRVVWAAFTAECSAPSELWRGSRALPFRRITVPPNILEINVHKQVSISNGDRFFSRKPRICSAVPWCIPVIERGVGHTCVYLTYSDIIPHLQYWSRSC